MSAPQQVSGSQLLERLMTVESMLQRLAVAVNTNLESTARVEVAANTLVKRALQENNSPCKLRDVMSTDESKSKEKSSTISVTTFWNNCMHAGEVIFTLKKEGGENTLKHVTEGYDQHVLQVVKDSVEKDKTSTQAWSSKSADDKAKMLYTASWNKMTKLIASKEGVTDEDVKSMQNLMSRVKADFDAFKSLRGLTKSKSDSKKPSTKSGNTASPAANTQVTDFGGHGAGNDSLLNDFA